MVDERGRRGPSGTIVPVLRRTRASVVRTAPVAAAVRTVHHRDLLPHDRLLASYPKSGNTWLRFMLAQLWRGEPVGWDDLGDVVPMVDRTATATATFADGARLVKTHDRCLRRYRVPGRRVVYVVRDGRDVAVSYYHHQRREGTAAGSLEAWLPRFLDGRVDRFGAWADHVESWLDVPAGDLDRLVVRYEDLLGDPVEGLGEVAEFLGLGVERPVLERVVADQSAERLRAREASSTYLARRSVGGGDFVRSARAGGWREVLDQPTVDEFTRRAGHVLQRLGYPV